MAKQNYLGEIINRSRARQKLTQDEFGQRFDVSGPAIFKFEKGYVRPSLRLWLRMAEQAEIVERRAVLLWLKAKLPADYEDYIELQGATDTESKKKVGKGSKKRSKKKDEQKTDYSKIKDRAKILTALAKDKSFPGGLRELIGDDELWALYKPNGREINLLRDVFGPLGRGSKSAYREGLCLIREFMQ